MRVARAFLTLVLATLSAVAAAAPLPDADDAVIRRLVNALKDSDPEVRQNIALALARIGPPAVEPLSDALKDTIPERRAGAAYALALIGPPARVALPILLDALNDKDVEVRRQASYAISRIVRPAVPGVPDRTPPTPRGVLP